MNKASSPPKPPPRKQSSAKKADHAPPAPSKTNYLDFYKKDAEGNYWFQRIPEKSWKENKEGWKTLIMRTMVDYFDMLVKTGLKPSKNKPYLEYMQTMNKFLKN